MILTILRTWSRDFWLSQGTALVYPMLYCETTGDIESTFLQSYFIFN